MCVVSFALHITRLGLCSSRCLARVPDTVNPKQTYSIILQEYAYSSYLDLSPTLNVLSSISISKVGVFIVLYQYKINPKL